MANKVIKLISLENIFSHKLKSYIYIYISVKNFYLPPRE